MRRRASMKTVSFQSLEAPRQARGKRMIKDNGVNDKRGYAIICGLVVAGAQAPAGPAWIVKYA